MKLKIIFQLVFLLCISLISACQRQTQKIIFTSNPALPYAVGRAVDPKQIELQEVLRKQKVQVITMGQDHLIKIPADLLFANQSPRLLWHSYDILYTVACYLRQFRKISVKVISYSSRCITKQREEALTRTRAVEVANYLWSQGIKSRFIFSSGVGSSKPILCTQEGGDDSTNSRIEITFRDEVA